nr:putative wax ester synthase/acyl-CoA:diacylglycerol acyltransferase [uncultured bacterium]
MKLSPSDASALLSESPSTPMHTGVLCLFALPKGAEPDYLARRFATMSAVAELREPFNMVLKRQRLPVDLPGWTESDSHEFRHHFRHLALPWPHGDNELAGLISDLHTMPLRQDRPLWECTLIEGLKGNRFALYFKTHQALLEMGDTLEEVCRWMSPVRGKKGRAIPWGMLLPMTTQVSKRGPVSLLFSAYGQALEQVKTVPGLTRALTRLATQAVKRNPQATLPYSAPNSILNTDISPQRRVMIISLEKSRLSALAKRHKVSLSEVVLALIGGGLGSYLNKNKALPAKPLIARSEIKLKIPAEKGQKAIEQSLPVLVNLATHEQDALQRLLTIRDSLRDSTQALAKMNPAGMQSYSNMLMWPYHLIKLAGVSGRLRPMFNLVVSEYERQLKPLYAVDELLLGLYPIATLADGHAAHIGYRSYAESVDLCVTVCPDSLPDIEQVKLAVQKELRRLEQ